MNRNGSCKLRWTSYRKRNRVQRWWSHIDWLPLRIATGYVVSSGLQVVIRILHSVDSHLSLSVLDDGGVAEIGTHDELVDQKGLYHELWSKQGAQEKDYEETKNGSVAASMSS